MKKYIIALAGGLVLSSAIAKETLEIKGSDTAVNLVQTLAEKYMARVNKDKAEDDKKLVSVTGGGSGTGISALINKKCDIANASREISQKEYDMAVKKGIEPKNISLAIDGLSVIVNPANPIDRLSREQIGRIFSGKTKKWNEIMINKDGKAVKGENKKINLYGRQPNSGTFAFFREEVVKGDYSRKMKQMSGNSSIVDAIKKDPYGIGYVGVGYVAKKSSGKVAEPIDGITVMKLLDETNKKKLKYTSPLNSDEVLSGRYPIARPIYQYFATLSDDAKAFIAFELSEEGQKIVEENGFYPLSKEYRERSLKEAGL